MKSKIIQITIIFSCLIIGITVIATLLTRSAESADTRSEQIVDANEISQLIEMGETAKAQQKLSELQQNLRAPFTTNTIPKTAIIICILSILCICTVFIYVYIRILRPFDKMKDFASEISKGNFDVPLKYERTNYFGAFTWAFDSMRKEIKSARMAEHEAIENNKTVIATLSHDIKTPIASIRAYAEGLEANMDSSPERRTRYLQVLMKKCDEVTALTNDLLLHSLSEMGRIEIKTEEFELVPFMEQTIEDITADKKDVIFTKPDFSPVVTADKKRMTQLVENLINNARKYGRTCINTSQTGTTNINTTNTDKNTPIPGSAEISISMAQKDGYVQITFADKGSGIPDEDMPFITDKFYRGKNSGSENGSGLGLYIVKYITEQTGGTLELQNTYPGLKVTVSLPLEGKVAERSEVG